MLLMVAATSYFTIINLEKQLIKTQIEINNLQIEIQKLNLELTSINNELKHYKLNRPTEYELKLFLSIDDTDKHEYKKGSYVCINFAKDLKVNAAKAGWNISFIVVNFISPKGEEGHALNGAYLADGRWVWIEPQNDKIYYGSIEEYLKEFFNIEWVQIEEYAIIW